MMIITEPNEDVEAAYRVGYSTMWFVADTLMKDHLAPSEWRARRSLQKTISIAKKLHDNHSKNNTAD